jgi:hypothetical protein
MDPPLLLKVALAVDNDVKAARIVKGRLERTVLGQVARSIKIVFKPGTGALFCNGALTGNGALVAQSVPEACLNVQSHVFLSLC